MPDAVILEHVENQRYFSVFLKDKISKLFLTYFNMEIMTK